MEKEQAKTDGDLTLNSNQLSAMKDLFEAIEREEFENNAGVLNNFEPYRLLRAYIFGNDVR